MQRTPAPKTIVRKSIEQAKAALYYLRGGGPKKPALQPRRPLDWAAQSVQRGLGFCLLPVGEDDFFVNLLIESLDDQFDF